MTGNKLKTFWQTSNSAFIPNFDKLQGRYIERKVTHQSLSRTVLRKAKKEALKLFNESVLEREAIAFKKLESLAQFALFRVFHRMGAFFDTETAYTRDQLMKMLGIIPQMSLAFDVYINLLENAEYINQTMAGGFRASRKSQEMLTLDSLQEFDQELDSLEHHNPELKSHLNLLSECICSMEKILRGELPAPNHSVSNRYQKMVEEIISETMIFKYFNQAIAACIKTLITFWSSRLKKNQKIRILQLGLETNGQRGSIGPILKPLGDRVEYYYTNGALDIYGLRTKNLDSDLSLTQSSPLELEVDPENQGAQHFDIIFATNIFHNSWNIDAILQNIKELLSVNGMIVVNEISISKVFSSLTFGLLDKRWLFNDQNDRLNNSSNWKPHLENRGFRHVTIIGKTDDLPGNYSGQALLLAESDGIIEYRNDVSINAENDFPNAPAQPRRMTS